MTKDNPITQEIPTVLGALCQDPRTKNKYISYYDTAMKKYKPWSLSHFIQKN